MGAGRDPLNFQPPSTVSGGGMRGWGLTDRENGGRTVMSFINPKDRVYKKPYKPPYMTAIARGLRKKPTVAEEVLWKALRKQGFFGLHFRRQAPFGRYVFDVYCAKKRFGVEIDGLSHIGKERYDRYRDEYVKGFKVRILRVSNDEVLADVEALVERIRREMFRLTERATGRP